MARKRAGTLNWQNRTIFENHPRFLEKLGLALQGVLAKSNVDLVERAVRALELNNLEPAHVNEDYARQTIFHGRIAHGMLSAGLISAVIGMQLPGPGTIYLGQDRAELETVCTNQDGVCVVKCTANVMPPKV